MRKFLATFAFLIFGLATEARAQQAASIDDPFRWHAKLYEVKLFPEDQALVKLRSSDLLVESLGILHYTALEGKFKHRVVEATLNSKPIPVYDDGSFNVRFGFAGETQTFVITAVDEKNKVHRIEYKIVPINVPQKVIVKTIPAKWRFNAGVGLTRLSYRQFDIQPFDENAVTVKAGAAYKIFPDWDLGVSAFYNAFVFGSNSVAHPSDEDQSPYKIQYLGINARIGYNLIKAPGNWRLNINGGLYYNIIFGRVGLSNLVSPQLYPELIYIFENGHSLLSYAKFSPAISGVGKFSLHNNREVALGMHYSFPYNETQRMSIGFDVSQLSLESTVRYSVAPTTGSTLPSTGWAATNTYSLSVGLSF